MDLLAFRYHEGAVHLPALGLWLDAHRPMGPDAAVFVSHAHADHTAAHARVLLSEPTRRLMRARVAGERMEQVLDFGRRYDGAGLGLPAPGLAITLLPAGHILGSAMLLLEASGTSLLYTGDFKLRPGLSAEACEPRKADLLIMETTYGRPEYVFPPTAVILESVIRFCREALDNDETPVLLGYSLGKSQEILSGLAGAGLPVALSGPAAKLTAVYESLGHRFPAHETLDAGKAAGKVVLAPPGMAISALRRRLGSCRIAVLTGWAVDPGCRFRHQADAAFPLSDHADFSDLVAFVRQVAPRRVFTLHGFAADFAAHLRGLGHDACALSEVEQLELSLGAMRRDPAARAVTETPATTVAEDALAPHDGPPFAGFARTCARIGSLRAKSEKVRLLADYLATIEPPALGWVTTWLAGGSLTADGRPHGAGWAVLRQAIAAAAGVSDADFRSGYLKHGDTGETAAALLAARPAAAQRGLGLQAVHSLLQSLAAAKGPPDRIPLLQRAFARCEATEARYLGKILTGNLRIGLKEGLVEEAVALAFGHDPEGIREAHRRIGRLGDVALMARKGRLDAADLQPFQPLRLMLASPEPTPEAIWERAAQWSRSSSESGTPTVWVEDKFDGIRCQLHRVGSRVAVYSRDLKEITAMFPELAEAARGLSADVILDGEILVMEGGRARPFADLQRRLGRREPDLFLAADLPVVLMAFDLLWQAGTSRLGQSLRERRAGLEALPLPPPLLRAPGHHVDSAAAIKTAFDQSRARGNEGLMVKDPGSAYLAGRRGLAWLKLKRALATLDCVIVAAEYGHGRRNGLLSDYTFAIRDPATGALRTLGKAYSGLTDMEIARLSDRLHERVVRRHGRRLEVEPGIVLEIAFDSIHPSTRHDSGLALRFPRIVRIRDDKAPADADTLATAWQLARATSAQG
ncbi:MAG: ATP-dependent DNA ligase [Verrucomicrobiae bacterium]|nr:ATP-dependent DNA ligase [Verrucomicrobiae bacterium]